MAFEKYYLSAIAESGRNYPGGPRKFARDFVKLAKKDHGFDPRREFNNQRYAATAFGTEYGSRIQSVAESGGFSRLLNQSDLSQVAESFGIAGDAIDPSVFVSGLSGIYTSEVEAGYDAAFAEVDEFFPEVQTPNQLGEKNIDIETMPTSRSRELAPGQPYPRTGVDGYSITMPKPQKRGLIAEVKLEHLLEGNTNERLDAARRVGEVIRQDCQLVKLRLLLGIDNTYKQNSTTLSTYLLSGSWTNRIDDFNQANGISEFDRANQLFAKMLDPITQMPIALNGGGEKIAYLPVENQYQTLLNVGTTSLWIDRGTPNNTQITNNIVPTVRTVTDQLGTFILTRDSGLTVAQRNSYIIYGWPKMAFRNRVVLPFQVIERNAMEDEPAWSQDIVYGCRARTFEMPYVYNPRYVALLRKMA